uniref:Multidrug and toxin extrusion protein n=1 Tax=Cynoglossus semilaevis TaxID=244447 RepID=A0A3P8VPN3_CYNSE
MAGADRDEAEAKVSSKMCPTAFVRRWLPLAYREELHQVLKLTGPLLLSRILNILLPTVITIFCGHIGNAALAGYALGSAFINVTTAATGFGLSVASDTLISQTYGNKNMKRVGVILQRSIIILLLFCLPCWAVLINSYQLLILLHQEEEVARIAQLYLLVFLPAVPAMYLHQLQVSYLQNQGIILPQMYTSVAANIINAGVNYVLIISLKMGILGSAIANSLSQIIICLLLFGYIRWKKLHEPTWAGWSIDSLREWGSYMKLALPSLFMVCLEWWIWDGSSFLSGLLGESALAAQHILDEIGTIVYMIPLGVNAAVCVRVGNALGAGNSARALVTTKVSLVLSGTLGVLQGIIIVSCKSVLGYIFTSDTNIVQIVSQCLNVYLFIQFFDAVLCVCTGILVGCGMQKIAAVSNLVGYYCVGMPVGIALMFPAKLGLLGLWLGLLTCVMVQTGLFLTIIYTLNWNKVSQKAQKRAGKKVLSVVKSALVTDQNEVLVSDVSDGFGTVRLEDGTVSEGDGYSPVTTQDQGLKPGHNTNLFLRRGLTALVLVLALTVGVAFHIAFPVPEFSAQASANSTMNWLNVSAPTMLPLLDTTLHL